MSVTTVVFGRKDNVVWLVGLVTLAAEPGHGCNWGGCWLEARNSFRAGFILPMQGSCSELRQMATGFDNVWMSKGDRTHKKNPIYAYHAAAPSSRSNCQLLCWVDGHRSLFHPSTMIGQRTVFWSSHKSGAVAEVHNTLRNLDWQCLIRVKSAEGILICGLLRGNTVAIIFTRTCSLHNREYEGQMRGHWKSVVAAMKSMGFRELHLFCGW
jgi:hypothetical protein